MRSNKSSKPKLLVSTSTFVRHTDDEQPRFILDLVKALQEYFSVTVLAPSFPGASATDRIEGVEVVRFRYAPLQSMETLAYGGGIMVQLKRQRLKFLLLPLFLWGQRRALARLCRDQNFDAIHAHWAIPQALVACSIPKKRRGPLITTCHGGDIYVCEKSQLKRFLSFCLRRSDKVVTVSEELRRLSASLMPEARVDRALDCIPMGIELKSYCATKATRTDASAAGHRDFVVTFVGRLVAKKGVATLIDALHRLRAQGTSGRRAVLQIIGDGPLRKTLQDQVVASGLQDSVTFLGWRHHLELPGLLRASDACVVPSVHADDGDKDGLPVTLLEAAASGTVVIGSEIAGIPDFIKHEENGLLCPPGDAAALADCLHRLMSDDDLRAQLAQKALEDVGSYNWPVIGQRYSKIINEAICENAL